MPIHDPPPRSNPYVTTTAANTNWDPAILNGSISIGSSITSDKIDWNAVNAPPAASEEAIRMVEVANDLAARMGISVKEAMDALQAAALTVRAKAIAENGPTTGPRMSVGVDEYGLLMRVAHMAAQLLPVMRDVKINEIDHGRYTALRNALVALQMHETTLAFDALGEDELARDLASLVEELAEPSTGSGST